jgi:O-antigen ligase
MHRYQTHLLNTARWGVVGVLLSISFSKALFNVSATLMILGWILSGNFSYKLRRVTLSPVAVSALVLSFVVYFSATYSKADSPHVYLSLGAYSKLLYIPLIVSLIDTPSWRRRCWQGFVLGMLVLLAHIYASIWIHIPWTRVERDNPWNVMGMFEHHIAQSIVVAFFAAYSLFRACGAHTKSWQVIWTALGLLSIVSITHLTAARTGQVTLIVALLILLLVSAPRSWGMPSAGVFIIAAMLLILSSSKLQERFELAYKEVATFQFKNDYSSIGARLRMWQVSLELIKERPLIGHGAGSYPDLAEKAFADEGMCKIGCAQPHNQYLLLGVESGLVGMLAFVGVMVSALTTWRRAEDHNPLIPVYVGILALTCMSDSGLFIRAQAYFFLPVLGLLVTNPIQSSGALTPSTGA